MNKKGDSQYESIWWVFRIILEKNHSVKELDTASPPPSYLTLTLTLTCMKMYKSDDQMIKSQSHSHAHSQNILILSSSLRCLDSRVLLSLLQRLDMRAFFSLAQPRDTCLLFSFSQPQYACIGLLCFPLTISSSFIAFHVSQKAAKSLQNQPKAAFLEKRACAFHHLLVCAFDSKSIWNPDVSFF